MKRSGVEMGQYDIDEGDQISDTGNRRIAKREADQPKRSPIRRKDKWRQEEWMKTKVKKNHKKIQHRLKYDWQGD
ncbi:MAG: hypothetical protein PVJ56_07380 [Desulfobacterales bacterium]